MYYSGISMASPLPTIELLKGSGSQTITCPHENCQEEVQVCMESHPYSKHFHFGEKPLSKIHDDVIVEFHEFLIHWIDQT